MTALEGLHVTGEYRNRSMQHTCSRHAAWDPHRVCALTAVYPATGVSMPYNDTGSVPPPPHGDTGNV